MASTRFYFLKAQDSNALLANPINLLRRRRLRRTRFFLNWSFRSLFLHRLNLSPNLFS
jgi:hypothetical protein